MGPRPAAPVAAAPRGPQIESLHDAPLTQIGKYQLTDLLGQGAMGVVYRALDPLLNRYVAIKLMSQGIASDAQLRDRFLREARAAGSLQHPNIITIFDFGEADGHLYIAMEYIEGADLSEVMDRRDPMPLTAKLDIIIDVLHALDYAHSRQLVHRDIKPANIRLSVDGRAKLMDFGIARLESSDLTKTGMLIGTPNYMAPEQVSSSQVSPATDIFSLGAVLYEFLTYRKTFAGDTLHAVLYQVVSEQPPPLRDVATGIPESLQAIVDRALAKDPAARFPSAADMAHALTAVRTELSSGSPVTIHARRTPLAERSPRRRLPWATVAVGGVVIAAAIWGVAAWRGASAAPGGSAPPGPVAGPASPSPPARAASPTPAAPGPGTAAASVRAPAPGSAPAGDQAAAPGNDRAAAPAPPELRRPEPSVPAVEPAPQVAAPAAPGPAPAPTGPAPGAPAGTPSGAVPTPVAPADDPRPDLEQLLAAYSRSIESRSVAEIRRAYPGLTGPQQQGWEQFFQTVRTVRARLAITGLDVSGTRAEFTVSGAYEYEASGGRTQRQPVSFRASAEFADGGWRLRTIR